MKRRLEIDALRGLMLVWMTLTHLPTALTPWVNQPFGYISSSEGFIFLSALFTGLIYFRLLDRDGPDSMNRRFFARTIRLYGYHVLLLMFAFLVAARIAMSGRTPALYNLLHFYFSGGAARAMIESLLLVYRPPLLDIIPLYIIFLVMSPFILLLATRTKIGWNYILGASFSLWLCAQFGLRQAAYGFVSHHFGVKIPLEEMGAFNLWAWQFMWIVGMWCGVRWAKKDLPVEKWADRVWRPALVIAIGLFAIRYSEIQGFDLGRLAPLFDKWRFAPVRIFDFAAVAALAVHFQRWLKPLAIRPLVLLGQSSLHVFCTHFLFCFAGLALMGQADHVAGWAQFALIAVTFSALLAVANASSKHEASAPARRPTGTLAPAPVITHTDDRDRRSRAA
jgi:hypothetical protein